MWAHQGHQVSMLCTVRAEGCCIKLAPELGTGALVVLDTHYTMVATKPFGQTVLSPLTSPDKTWI